MSASYSIELLTRQHKTKGFDCGDGEDNAMLNQYIRQFAFLNSTLDVSKTYVAVCPETQQVKGYYTLSTGAVALAALPATKGMPRIVPTIHLGRLARDKSVLGQGLGPDLLIHALKNSLIVASIVGARFVEVHSFPNEKTRKFYADFGFTRFLDDELHLYIPMATIRELDLQ